jgi:hypothetical protein
MRLVILVEWAILEVQEDILVSLLFFGNSPSHEHDLSHVGRQIGVQRGERDCCVGHPDISPRHSGTPNGNHDNGSYDER